ncbi:MAG: hypothetical protein B9S32_09270 [Verrucomicrobia bacterium Tous-C9LFEB]|nr:MAG: hypothetical protein B9S32_09270 [Verrucomicrobia bacterium Tous-C9LFEB]
MKSEMEIELEIRRMIEKDPDAGKLIEYMDSLQDQGLSGVTAYLIVDSIWGEYTRYTANNAEEAKRIEIRRCGALQDVAEHIWYDPRNDFQENWPYKGNDYTYYWREKKE